MTEYINLLLFIAGVVFCSPYLARILRLPVLAVEILLGSLCASAGLIADSDFYELGAHIGFCFLMFLAGLEVSLADFAHLRGALLRKMVIFYLLLYAQSALFAELFGLNRVFIIIIPAMSVGLIAILMQEFSADNKWLNQAMITAALGEIVTILLTTVMNSFANGGAPMISVLALLAFLAIFLLIFYLIRCLFWWFPALKNVLIPPSSKAEQGLRSALSLWICALCLMLLFGFELALGAFLAGMFIASFYEDAHALEERLSALGYGFLVPIFFSHVGINLDLFALEFSHIRTALILAFCMLFVRLSSSLIFWRLMRAKCLLMGASTTMPLTLLIAIATLASRLGLIDQKIFSAIVLCALFQAVVFMWLIPRAALLFETKFEQKS